MSGSWVGLLCSLVLVGCCVNAYAGPVVEPWATDVGAADVVAAATLSGWYATGDTATDVVEIRDVREDLMGSISRSDFQALAPWMTLDSSLDGPRALAWTDSGRSLFIVVTDDSQPSDGLGSDVILKYETATGGLSLFARADIGGGTGASIGAVHFRGVLSVGTQAGAIRVYHAGRNDTSGSLWFSWSLPAGEPARGFAIGRSIGLGFVVTDSMLYRYELADQFPVVEQVGAVASGRGVAYSDHYGSPADQGAYIVEGAGGGSPARVVQVPVFQATGLLAYSPLTYLESTGDLSSISATACGRLMLGGQNGPEVVRDSGDTRLDYEAWLGDEFDQVVAFGEGLISPGGEPVGWVLDGDVQPGGVRFQPASPDAAAWVVMLLMVRDHLNGDTGSVDQVRQVLMRYAGQMPDGIGPSMTTDGILRHWIDPWTGGVKPGWNPEFATLSTMQLVVAADRARRFYRADTQVVSAADAIINRVGNWDAYIQTGTNALYFLGNVAGGPDFSTAASPFHEGEVFVEQAAHFGASGAALSFWLDRSLLPQSQFVSGFPMTTNWPGGYLAAFVTHFPFLLSRPLRMDPTWQVNMENLLLSNGAWTDDNGPRFMTVFSAGTTKPEWGGYNADSLANHPGDITTFPSLMAFGSSGRTAPTVAAYHAYRHGARQSFSSGASILYRRSDADPGYEPNDAGMPDVALGAMGLAEIIKPGTAQAVLAVDYQFPCPADRTEPFGVLDFFDVAAFLDAFSGQQSSADLAQPFGVFDFFDVSTYLELLSDGCP